MYLVYDLSTLKRWTNYLLRTGVHHIEVPKEFSFCSIAKYAFIVVVCAKIKMSKTPRKSRNYGPQADGMKLSDRMKFLGKGVHWTLLADRFFSDTRSSIYTMQIARYCSV